MQIRWAPEARRELQGIWRYIALDDAAAADRMATRLVVAVEKLAHFAHLGRPGREGTRELVVSGTPFMVVDRVGAVEIRIVTVLHGAQREET
jgi:toxin ParE1/3/4